MGSGKKIVLPKVDEIKEIEIVDKDSKRTCIIGNKDEIIQVLSQIVENSKVTNKESVNDQPTNVDSYITMILHPQNTKENPRKVYFYKKKDISYIEQAYSGIWELTDEAFNSISSKLNEK